MQINSYRPFVVVSAARPDNSNEENFTAHEELKAYIGAGFVEGGGVTQQYGTERVLILFEYTPDDIAHIKLKYKQDAVLLVDQFRNACLLTFPFKREYIGVWAEITEPEAEAVDHTMVLGKYFKDGKPRYYACK